MNTSIDRHLSHEQLCDILLAPSAGDTSPTLEAAEDHLRNCLMCSSELEGLRRSLIMFRQASKSYAEYAYAHPAIQSASIAPSPRFRSHVLYWATAAALAIAVTLPFSLHHRQAPMPHTKTAATPIITHSTQSDEALLDGIDQDLSADVPAAMQPLADPIDGTTSSPSAQRKN